MRDKFSPLEASAVRIEFDELTVETRQFRSIYSEGIITSFQCVNVSTKEYVKIAVVEKSFSLKISENRTISRSVRLKVRNFQPE